MQLSLAPIIPSTLYFHENTKPQRYRKYRNNVVMMANDNRKVAILMGSKNDMPKMQGAVDALNNFNIESDVQVMSAHRQPLQVCEMATNGRDNGYSAFICGAGMSAHLAGVVSAHTTLPVVGVPISSGNLSGIDSLYSTVQMPKGIPVATVAIDGSYNAGMWSLKCWELMTKISQKKLGICETRQVINVKIIVITLGDTSNIASPTTFPFLTFLISV